MEKTYELMPNAKMLLSSLRSVGYTEETAIELAGSMESVYKTESGNNGVSM